MPRLGAGGGLRLPAHVQRQPRRALPHLDGDRRGGLRRALRSLRAPRRGDGRGGLRRQHDDAQLRTLALAAREWSEGDEIVVTRLDHDANVAPWLALAEDKRLTVHFCELDSACRLDLDHLRSLLSPRTRSSLPWASNAVGTLTPASEIVELVHAAGALAWVDAVHYAPHGEIDVPRPAPTSCSARPTSSSGRTSALPSAVEGCSRAGARTRCARRETGRTAARDGHAPHELLAGFIATVEYLHGVGWSFITTHERMLGELFLAGLPADWTLHGPPTMEGRVPTFALSPPGERPEDAAARLGEAGFAVWHGNYYAVEVMRHLGLPEGALRIGIVHTNTEDEVDRLLAALSSR